MIQSFNNIRRRYRRRPGRKGAGCFLCWTWSWSYQIGKPKNPGSCRGFCFL